MSRTEVTTALSKLLVSDTLYRSYWANEVTFDAGSPTECRVDFVAFRPENHSVSGIERGVFTAYEVKSCVADFHSPNGHNFFCDRNYYVMPMEVYKKVVTEINLHKTGVYCPIPRGNKVLEEFENPTPFTGENLNRWSMKCVAKQATAYAHQCRKRPLQEMLFMMLRSGRDYSFGGEDQ